MKTQYKKKNFKGKKQMHVKEEINIDVVREKIVKLDPDEISKFSLLPLCKATQNGLSESGFIEPTKVQKQTLVHSLQGFDVVGEAKTGSGKTLAFVIPILELLYRQRWNRMDGLGVVVLTPTRELAYQIYEVFNKVGKHHTFSVGLVIGGKDLKFEWTRISLCNILICTPGRLLQHMTENSDFFCDNVQMLVLDEADRCLSMGFEDTMNTILEDLPKDKQTLLFSATQTRDVKNLIRAGCKNPVFCSVHEYSKTSTPKTLKESYVVFEEEDKIKFLWSFLRHHKKNKILVFLSTCKQAKFINDLFTKLRPGLTVMTLHGHMHQLRRMAVYDEFCNKKHAVLFATDVAARGLDIPKVDWVIQLDCPEDATTYIHRAGRTARHTKSGESLLVLTPSQEENMVNNLKKKNIIIEKIFVDLSKLQSIQLKIEFSLSKNPYLKEEAERAFKHYIKNLWFMKNQTHVTSINLDSLARSFGLAVTPKLRFHEKKLKMLDKNKAKSIEKDKTQTSALEDKTRVSLEEDKSQTSSGKEITPTHTNFDLSDEESDDDFLHKSKSQPIRDEEKPEDILKDYSLFVNPIKDSFSKYDVAKKVLKKKLQVNNKIVFNDDGDPLADPSEAQESTEGHHKFNLLERQEFLRAQDKLDKLQNSQRVKEKHRLEKAKLKALKQKKEEEEEGDVDEEDGEYETDSDIDDTTRQIIDDLPDPDEIYNNDNANTQSDEEIENDFTNSLGEKSKYKHSSKKEKRQSLTSDDAEEDLSESKKNKTSKRNFGGKRKAKEEARAVKKAKVVAENDLSSIPFSEKESLALYLLQGS